MKSKTEQNEIHEKILNEFEDELEILITYKFKGKIKTIMPDENIEFVEYLMNKKDIYIVCFDNSKEALKILEKSKNPIKIFPSDYYEEWSEFCMKYLPPIGK